jgi:hypothetical protein
MFLKKGLTVPFIWLEPQEMTSNGSIQALFNILTKASQAKGIEHFQKKH